MMNNEIKKENFEFDSFYSQATAQLLDKIKDDDELLQFIGLYSKSSKVVLYEKMLIGFSYVSSGSWPEIQIAILKEFRNRGYGKALTDRLVRDCFEQNCMGVKLLIDKDNEISMKSAEACGFYREDNEELNPLNKEDKYYTYIKRNPNYRKIGR